MKTLLKLLLILTICQLVLSLPNCTYSNPLFNYKTPNPWITHHNGSFYFVTSPNWTRIDVYKSSRLSDWSNRVQKTVWTPPDGTNYSKEIWAPEIHFINGKWYIYFAADDGDNNNHRMYVLESVDEDALGQYKFRGLLDTEEWAIDGTVWTHRNKSYFVWSGWQRSRIGFPQNLYITEMESPIKLKSKRVMIGEPNFDWEKRGEPLGILEGPQSLINPGTGQVFITYSASACWSRFYSIGALELRGADPMNTSSWHHHDQPLFKESDRNKVYGTGHASFIQSGNDFYIAYHAMDRPNEGTVNLTARLQRFDWENKTGYPNFGEPLPIGKLLPAPTGDC